MNLKIVAALMSIGAIVGIDAPANARPAFHHGHRVHQVAPTHHGKARLMHRHFRARGRHHANHIPVPSLVGVASWYGPGFQGRKTASGETFNTNTLTAAHRSLPLGCRVLVTNRSNGRSVVVRINDRGPYVGGKVIDLSRASARAIGMGGTAPVSLSRL